MSSPIMDSDIESVTPQPDQATSAQQMVGLRLRAMRSARGLSIHALAKMSGLSVNTIGLIERGRTSPNVNTLQQLAVQLQQPLSAFFDVPALANPHVVHQEAGQRPRLSLKRGTLLEDLAFGMPPFGVEPLIFIMEAQAESGKVPCVHMGREFVYCLGGHILYFIEQGSYLLSPGDSLIFDAQLLHRWKNPDPAPSSALIVFCSLERPERPVESHFAG